MNRIYTGSRCFIDIQPDSFRWYGLRTLDGGLTWIKEAEFFGSKMEPRK